MGVFGVEHGAIDRTGENGLEDQVDGDTRGEERPHAPGQRPEGVGVGFDPLKLGQKLGGMRAKRQFGQPAQQDGETEIGQSPDHHRTRPQTRQADAFGGRLGG